MSRPGIIIQARLTSKRFPNKVISPLLGKTVIDWVIDACVKSGLPVVVAIPENMTNNGLKAYLSLSRPDIRVYRGSEEDLTQRFYDVAVAEKFDPIIRVCGDSPFVDPKDILSVLDLYYDRKFKQQINYVQCFGMDELEYAKKNNVFIASREHVVMYMDHTVDFPEDIKRLEDDWNNEESPTMIARKADWKFKNE